MQCRSTVALLAVALLDLAMTESRAATLVAQYEFANSGNLGQDSSGFGNNGVVGAGVTQVPGFLPWVEGAHFNGSGVISVPPLAGGFTGSPGVSFSGWIKVDPANSGTYNGFISQDPGGCCNYRILVDSANQPYINSGSHDDHTYTATVTPGQWNFIALTEQNVGSSHVENLYVNGVALPAETIAGNLPSTVGFNTYLGSGEGGGAWLLQGSLSDMRVYQGVLTSDQVNALFTVPEPGSLVLGGLGLAGLFITGRRRKA
jgi:hypothetical protein